jgi:hypothetical protein
MPSYYDFLFNCLNISFYVKIQNDIIDCNKCIYINADNINNAIKCAALNLNIKSSKCLKKLNFIDAPIIYLNAHMYPIINLLEHIEVNYSIRVIVFYWNDIISVIDKIQLSTKFPNLNFVLGTRCNFNSKIIANFCTENSQKCFCFNDEHEFTCNIDANKIKMLCCKAYTNIYNNTWCDFLNLFAVLDSTKIIKNANKF